MNSMGKGNTMIAKQLEAIIAEEAEKTDFSHRSSADMVQRFQSLRGYGLLPRGRGKNAQHLILSQVAAGILSISTEKPGYSGLASKVLMKLRPVGGVDASFEGCGTFGKAIEAILDNSDALASLVEIRVSGSEIYNNGYGRAAIEYRTGDTQKTAHFIGELAVSLLQPGAEKNLNPRDLISSVIKETVFFPPFFDRISREIRIEIPKHTLPLEINHDEEDEEARKEKRAQKLGIRPGSRYLNMAVDCQVTWPKEETVVEFDSYKLILLPKTKDNTTSIHIDLYGQKITPEDAHTLFNRFLSLMTWCDDQFSIQQDGWSGNPVPLAVPKRNLAFATAHHWAFGRKIPDSQESRTAIAIYRDARNAQQNYMIPYAVLSYYKIIELKHKGRSEAKTWFRDNFEVLRQSPNRTEDLTAFEAACGSEKPEDYLWRACRCAVAHANKPYSIDPDDFHELRRLHEAADVLRALARLFIQTELGISDCFYDGT